MYVVSGKDGNGSPKEEADLWFAYVVSLCTDKHIFIVL